MFVKGTQDGLPTTVSPTWAASELLEPALPPRDLHCPTHGTGWGRVGQGEQEVLAQTISKTVEGFEAAEEGDHATEVIRRDPFLGSEVKPETARGGWVYGLQSLWPEVVLRCRLRTAEGFPSLKPSVFERPRSVTGSETTLR